MNNPTTSASAVKEAAGDAVKIDETIVEIVSDSGEGAQKCGQSLGNISARMGNGVWTVEIIPAEIQPPARSRAGASGIRVRIGSGKVTNMGDKANIVVALNEQVLYGRIDQGAFDENTTILLENKWADSKVQRQREQYAKALEEFAEKGYTVIEVPMEVECLKVVDNAKKGKNMWALGMLAYIYSRDLQKTEDQIKRIFHKKSDAIIDSNLKLMNSGYEWAKNNLDLHYHIPGIEDDVERVVMNGNEAISLGVLSAGMEVCSMYPITPATSASHHLAECIERAGGVVHQAEDEIAAVGFAIGTSYAGKTAVTITSGPGIALKTEFLGLASMSEVPLVIVDVQRGGPSTGLPTKVEQGDLLAILHGQPGDAPKVVMAPATIEECLHFVVLARKMADSFRIPVFVMTDANLATGVQPFPRPKVKTDWFAPPIDQSPWKEGVRPYEWDLETGMSKRPIPGQKGGMYALTGLAHDEESHVAYDPEINQRASKARSRKLAAIGETLKPPKVNGEKEGDLLIVGWGSTKGAIDEAVEKAQKQGAKVSSLHLRFLSPIEPGLKEIFKNFKKVMTVEINYGDEVGDPMITEDNRRYSQLAWYLRAHTLTDVDFYSNVYGQPMSPGRILKRIKQELNY